MQSGEFPSFHLESSNLHDLMGDGPEEARDDFLVGIIRLQRQETSVCLHKEGQS